MTTWESQETEIKTIEPRKLTLDLSDADVERIKEKAGAVGFTVGKLLENFIGDLVGGTYSNGSDERDLAQDWFDRCWFGMFPEKTFQSFLIGEGLLEEALLKWENINGCEKSIAKSEKDIKAGGIFHGRTGTYSWKNIVSSDGKPCYASLAEWEAAEREYIASEQEDMEYHKEELDEIWEEFLSWTDNPEGKTLETEIAKVLEWQKLSEKELEPIQPVKGKSKSTEKQRSISL
ncbi:MAG: hypothetical protein H2212_03705 [Ruminococcus sp.]|nr:hypothetical protein [Ruminococcus sp.]